MTGAHVSHRVANKPLVIGGIAIPKVDGNGNTVMRWVSKPVGIYDNGRCTDWVHYQEPVTRHVLDYRPAPAWPGKHAGGRTRKLDGKNRVRLGHMRRRSAQASKSAVIDASKLHMMLPG
jgi:hypothetical protein